MTFARGYRAARRLLPPRGEQKEKGQAGGPRRGPVVRALEPGRHRFAQISARGNPRQGAKPHLMDAAQVQARAVAKVAIIALAVIAAALVVVLVVLNTRTTLHWVVVAVFFALALAPAVGPVERLRIRGRTLPRWLAILVVYVGFLFFAFVLLQVIPPMVKRGREAGVEAADLHHRLRGLGRARTSSSASSTTSTTSPRPSRSRPRPCPRSSAARRARRETSPSRWPQHLRRDHDPGDRVLPAPRPRPALPARGRQAPARGGRARAPDRRGRSTGWSSSYITVTLALAIAAGIFTWIMLELLGVPLAVPLAVLVAFLDLIPLIGLHPGRPADRDRRRAHRLPDRADRLGRRLPRLPAAPGPRHPAAPLPRGAVRLNPAISIVAVLVGAELLGILGALIAIPVAGSIGVISRSALAAYQRFPTRSTSTAGPIDSIGHSRSAPARIARQAAARTVGRPDALAVDAVR